MSIFPHLKHLASFFGFVLEVFFFLIVCIFFIFLILIRLGFSYIMAGFMRRR